MSVVCDQTITIQGCRTQTFAWGWSVPPGRAMQQAVLDKSPATQKKKKKKKSNGLICCLDDALPDVCFLLGATLDEHGDDLDLLALCHLDLHELVTRLLKLG